MAFQTPQHKLSELLRRIENGLIQLPDFQRGYKWDEERIRSLLVTITLGHPLGAILLLQTGNDQVRFKPKPLEGSPAPAAQEADHLLLDGQQRLTSLYQALTGDGVVETMDSRNKRVRRQYFIRLDEALSGEVNRDEAIVSLPADGIVRSDFNRRIDLDLSTPEKERMNGYFPIRLIFNQAEGTSWILQHPDRGVAIAFLNDVMQPMLAYDIPAIELDRATTKAAVATVFEKVNTGGLPLDVFELLTATFAGDAGYFGEHGTDFRLGDDWAITVEQLKKPHVLGEFSNIDFLQVVALLATLGGVGATSAKRGSILRLTLAEYLAWAPKVREAIVWVAEFLDQESVHWYKDVPYSSQMVPLTAIRVLLGAEADLHGVRSRLRRWYWCGVLGELYGGSIETRFARDVEQVPAWVRAAVTVEDVPEPNTVEQANFFESRLLSLQRRNSAAYKGIHALIMATGCRDWMSNKVFDRASYWDLSVDIHHIFPQEWCKQQGYESWVYNSIINKTALAAATNRSIGGVAPSRYLPRVEKKAGLGQRGLDDILSAHLIDPELLRSDDFEGFFVARRHALLALVEQAMGKPAQRDVEDEMSGGEESPAAFDDDPADLTDDDLEMAEDS